MKETSDSELMRQVRGGRTAALATLFERHHARLYRYCLRMTGNRSAAEDLVQDVFMKMLKYKATFKDDSEFVPWMFGIGRNACLAHLRRTADDHLRATHDVDGRRSPTKRHESRATTGRDELVRRALLRLPADRREVLVLSRYEYKTYDEIAKVLECSVGAVKVRAHRAMKQLREIYLDMAGEVRYRHDAARTPRRCSWIGSKDRSRRPTSSGSPRTWPPAPRAAPRPQTMTAMWERPWQRSTTDVPHERLRARFHAGARRVRSARVAPLDANVCSTAGGRSSPRCRSALAAALALVGVLVGQQLPSPVDAEVAALRDEVRTVGLALLDHQSASERLLGVEWSRRTAQTPEVVNALLERVQYDSNLSVRLAAVDALRAELDRPDVSAGLALALDEAGIAADAGGADRRVARDGQRRRHRSRARDLGAQRARSRPCASTCKWL